MQFGVYANIEKPGLKETFDVLLPWIKKNRIVLSIPNALKDILGEQEEIIVFDSLENLVQKSDLLLSMGGDGTMLSAANHVGRSGTPIMGINLGGLGFLTQASLDNMIEKLNSIVSGNYTLEKRMLLEAKITIDDNESSFFAFNDIVFNRAGSPRMMRMEVSVDGSYFNTYVSDGLILSTPTGSTAYSLSAWGPIVLPSLESIILNPICPHAVTVRPTIIPPESVIEITIGRDEYEPFLSIDGQRNVKITVDTKVKVQKADYYISLVSFKESNFFTTLREKLQWGQLPRK